MARFRRALAMRPVHTVKHYVTTNGSANANATTNRSIAAVANSGRQAISLGATVKNVFLEYWIASSDTTVAAGDAFAVMVYKLEAGDTVPDNTSMLDPGGWNNRKNIFYYSRGLASSVQMPTPVIRSWLKIPRGKSRFGEGDQLMITFTSTKAYAYCGFATYKEYE